MRRKKLKFFDTKTNYSHKKSQNTFTLIIDSSSQIKHIKHNVRLITNQIAQR